MSQFECVQDSPLCFVTTNVERINLDFSYRCGKSAAFCGEQSCINGTVGLEIAFEKMRGIHVHQAKQADFCFLQRSAEALNFGRG